MAASNDSVGDGLNANNNGASGAREAGAGVAAGSGAVGTPKPKRGHRRKGSKHSRSTHKSFEERIEVARKLLSARMRHGDVKRYLKNTYGVATRQAETYIARARKLMREETGRPKDEHVADSYAFYCSVIADPNASHKDKLRAQELLDKLLGLPVPFRIAQTDSKGNDLTPDAARAEFDRIAAILRERARVAEAQPGHGQNGRSSHSRTNGSR